MYKPSVSRLNASSTDIINTIRANASPAFQSKIPKITKATEIPVVGELIWGYPALANEYVSTLVNQIAAEDIKSANFYNPYADLKKGYLSYGETVEEVFVSATKAREFNAELAERRELKRSLPDVRAAFHALNWKAQYPVTVQRRDLQRAFRDETSMMGLISKITNAPYTGNQYDEFLLFKYLIIKAIARKVMYQKKVDSTDPDSLAMAMKEMSNRFQFMSSEYNSSNVTTMTAVDDQYLFMDAANNANYSVKTLAGAFNMDEVKFQGHLKLMDNWTTFDNDRFLSIVESSNMIEPVTPTELELMSKVKAVLVDREFFQVYDNYTIMDETKVSSGMYWNYFLNVGKTVSYSPFSNCVVFMSEVAEPDASVEFTVESIYKSDEATIITLQASEPAYDNFRFTQSDDATTKGIAVHPYGVYIFPKGQTETTPAGEAGGASYTGTAALDTSSVTVGATVTLNKDA